MQSMQHSDKPYEELELAKEAAAAMGEAKSFREFELSWKKFLHHIDRVWNKAFDHFVKAPGWFGWSGKFMDLRKRDALLSYLFQARNSDEHSVREIAEQRPGSLSINPATPGGAVYIDHLSINNGVVTIGPGTVGVIHFEPARIALLPVKAKDGRIYPPPTMHLGQKIDHLDYANIAAMALAFYQDFLDQAENKFIKA